MLWLCGMLMFLIFFFVEGYGDHRDLHVLTHSFPHDALPICGASTSSPAGSAVRAAGASTSAEDAQRTTHRSNAATPTADHWSQRHGRPRRDRKSTRLNSSH